MHYVHVHVGVEVGLDLGVYNGLQKVSSLPYLCTHVSYILVIWRAHTYTSFIPGQLFISSLQTPHSDHTST